MRKNETIRALAGLFRAGHTHSGSGLDAEAMLAAGGLLIERVSVTDAIGGEVDDVLEQTRHLLEMEGWSERAAESWLEGARRIGMIGASHHRAREQELRASVPAPAEDGTP